MTRDERILKKINRISKVQSPEERRRRMHQKHLLMNTHQRRLGALRNIP